MLYFCAAKIQFLARECKLSFYAALRILSEIKFKKTGTVLQCANSEDFIDDSSTFINGYVDNCNKIKQSISAVEWVFSNEPVTNNFKIELNKAVAEAYKQESELGPGTDSIFTVPDYPDSGFEPKSFNNKNACLIIL